MRGFAAGIVVAAGYGFGAQLITTFGISDMLINSVGYKETSWSTFGIILGVVGVAAAVFLKSAPTVVEVRCRQRR